MEQNPYHCQSFLSHKLLLNVGLNLTSLVSWSLTETVHPCGRLATALLLSKSQIPLRYLVRSWFKLVADRFEPASNLSATSFETASNQLRTSFEPDTVMEFGFYRVFTNGAFSIEIMLIVAAQ